LFLEDKLVGDFDALGQHDVAVGNLTPLPALAHACGSGKSSVETGHETSYRGAFWMAGGDEGSELNNFSGGELESLEVSVQNFVFVNPSNSLHDGGVSGATVVVNQQNLGAVSSVQSNQFPDKDLVGAVDIVDLESESQVISDLRGDHILSKHGSDAHADVGGRHNNLLDVFGGGVELDFDAGVEGVSDGLVLDFVPTVQGEADVGPGHDHVVVLDDDVGSEISGSILHDVTVDGIVGQVDAELGAIGDVFHAAVGPGPGVHLSVEHGRGGDLGNHLGRLAFDGDGVASLEFVGGSVLDRQVGLLDVGEGSRGVVRQTADGFSGRHEVVRVAGEVGL